MKVEEWNGTKFFEVPNKCGNCALPYASKKCKGRKSCFDETIDKVKK
jgi:hypothetical protein